MARKAKNTENEQTTDLKALSEVEVTGESSSGAEVVPVVEAEAEIEIEADKTVPVIVEANAQVDDDGDMYRQDLQTLALKLAELEAKFDKLETELSTLVQKKEKRMRLKKGNKVKCKCKGKMVPLEKCKCKSKKQAKLSSKVNKV
jgi:ABC-type phosphate transport system auxiliary subunit